MWIFLSGGMMMPALLPEQVLRDAKTPDIQEAVERGWDLQVRGRVREHLEWFIREYMPEGGNYSVVYASPNKDYNVRFYTTRADFGAALAQAALAMDYVKFKDTAKRFAWGQKYYDLLLKVWSASTMLGRPYWGESKKAPKSKKRKNRYERPVGSSFLYGDDDRDMPRLRATLERDDYFWGPRSDVASMDTMLEDQLIHGKGSLKNIARRLSIHEMNDAELDDYLEDRDAVSYAAEIEELALERYRDAH